MSDHHCTAHSVHDATHRTVAKLIRFSPDELAWVDERAHACGRSPARFIRETALGAIPRARRHSDTDPILRELARIGRDLDSLSQLLKQDTNRSESTPLSSAVPRRDTVDCIALSARLSAVLDAHRDAIRQVVERGIDRHPAVRRESNNHEHVKLATPFEGMQTPEALEQQSQPAIRPKRHARRRTTDAVQGTFW